MSLPGQVSFLTSIAPICVAMGIPIEPLALLIAVEMIPDLVRTVGNVTMDVAATTAIARMGTGQAAGMSGTDDLAAGDGEPAPRDSLATATATATVLPLEQGGKS